MAEMILTPTFYAMGATLLLMAIAVLAANVIHEKRSASSERKHDNAR